MIRVLIACLALALVAFAPVAGGAKPLSKIIAQSGLSPEDFTLMRAAENKLFQADAPVAGRSAAWDNPETGSRGTVVVASVRDGCAYLEHTFHPKGRETPEDLKYRLCRAADGVWRLTP